MTERVQTTKLTKSTKAGRRGKGFFASFVLFVVEGFSFRRESRITPLVSSPHNLDSRETSGVSRP